MTKLKTKIKRRLAQIKIPLIYWSILYAILCIFCIFLYILMTLLDWWMTEMCIRDRSEAIDDQSQADRDARKSPPIYICVKLAGSIEFVTIEVYVNR